MTGRRRFVMDLKEIMQKKRFVVVGDTLNEEKYACKIKHALLEHGYQVQIPCLEGCALVGLRLYAGEN